MSNKALSARHEYFLELLKSTELITYNNWHNPKITSAGIDLLKDIHQIQLNKTPLAPTPEEILKMPPELKSIFTATEESALDAFVKTGILDTDNRTITDEGLKFFLGMMETVFQGGFNPITVSSITVTAEEVAEKGESILDKFEPSKNVLRKKLVAAILELF